MDTDNLGQMILDHALELDDDFDSLEIKKILTMKNIPLGYCS